MAFWNKWFRSSSQEPSPKSGLAHAPEGVTEVPPLPEQVDVQPLAYGQHSFNPKNVCTKCHSSRSYLEHMMWTDCPPRIPSAPAPGKPLKQNAQPSSKLDIDKLKRERDVKGLLAVWSSTRNEDMAVAAGEALGQLELNTRLSCHRYCAEAITHLALFHRDASGFEEYSKRVNLLREKERQGESVSRVPEMMMTDFLHKRTISEINLRRIGLNPKTLEDARTVEPSAVWVIATDGRAGLRPRPARMKDEAT